MKKLLAIFLCAAALLRVRAEESPTVFPGKEWEEAAPYSQGIDSTNLTAAIEEIKTKCGSDGVRKLVIVRHGRLIWKGDNIDKVHVPEWDMVIVRLGLDGNVPDEVWDTFVGKIGRALL